MNIAPILFLSWGSLSKLFPSNKADIDYKPRPIIMELYSNEGRLLCNAVITDSYSLAIVPHDGKPIFMRGGDKLAFTFKNNTDEEARRNFDAIVNAARSVGKDNDYTAEIEDEGNKVWRFYSTYKK